MSSQIIKIEWAKNNHRSVTHFRDAIWQGTQEAGESKIDTKHWAIDNLQYTIIIEFWKIRPQLLLSTSWSHYSGERSASRHKQKPNLLHAWTPKNKLKLLYVRKIMNRTNTIKKFKILMMRAKSRKVATQHLTLKRENVFFYKSKN